jgi:hypothetical protein
LNHETYRERARGEKRLTYLAQAPNNWDDQLVTSPEIKDRPYREALCRMKTAT